MQKENIIEALADCIENKIFEEWKHDGYIDQTFSNAIDVEIDGRHYTVELTEHEEKDNND